MTCDGTGLMPLSADRDAMLGTCSVCEREVALVPAESSDVLGDMDDDPLDVILVAARHS